MNSLCAFGIDRLIHLKQFAGIGSLRIVQEPAIELDIPCQLIEYAVETNLLSHYPAQPEGLVQLAPFCVEFVYLLEDGGGHMVNCCCIVMPSQSIDLDKRACLWLMAMKYFSAASKMYICCPLGVLPIILLQLLAGF